MSTDEHACTAVHADVDTNSDLTVWFRISHTDPAHQIAIDAGNSDAVISQIQKGWSEASSEAKSTNPTECLRKIIKQNSADLEERLPGISQARIKVSVLSIDKAALDRLIGP